MTDLDEWPESDRAEGALHPRLTTDLIGQSAAESEFLTAFNSGRQHHGWLISGPRGIGKATLAWRIARFLLATPAADNGGLFADERSVPKTLGIDAGHPVNARVAALSDPGLFLLRPAWDAEKKRFKSGITVDEARKLKSFFNLSAADGGRRIVIVDSADELNVNAANALLKILEEPPADATILLVSHQPSRLLPTIRSRCRELRCGPLSAAQLSSVMIGDPDQTDDGGAVAELAGGSVGEAVRLNNLEGMQAYSAIVEMFNGLPNMDRQKALVFAESVAGKSNAARFDLVLRLMDIFLARVARTGISGPPLVEAATGESELMLRLSPDAQAARSWAELQQTLGARSRHGRAVHLDPAALILDMIFKINDTAASLLAR